VLALHSFEALRQVPDARALAVPLREHRISIGTQPLDVLLEHLDQLGPAAQLGQLLARHDVLRRALGYRAACLDVPEPRASDERVFFRTLSASVIFVITAIRSVKFYSKKCIDTFCKYCYNNQ
jgi:hypothetical protein